MNIVKRDIRKPKTENLRPEGDHDSGATLLSLAQSPETISDIANALRARVPSHEQG